MRTTTMAGAALAAAIWACGPAAAEETAVASKIDRVTVYPDGATVVRVIEVDLPAGTSSVLTRDLPLAVDRTSVRVEGEAKGPVEIGSVEVTAPQPGEQPKPDEAAIQRLEDRIAELDDAVMASGLRLKYLMSVAEGRGKETSPADPDIKRTAATIAEQAAVAGAELRLAKLAKREPERRLAALRSSADARPPARYEVRINVAARQAGRAVLRLSYSVSGASWRPAYDAALTTGAKPQLKLARRAEVSQSTGEDWSEVALSVSTLRMSRGTQAGTLSPLLARYRPKAVPVPMAAPAAPSMTFRASRTPALAEDSVSQFVGTGSSVVAGMQAQAPVQEMLAQPENVGLDVSYRIAGRSAVPSDRTMRTFLLASAEPAADVVLEAVPELDEQAFLQASWKHDEEAPLLAGQVTLRRDGTFVGRGRMPVARKGEPVRLGFGVDDAVRVKRDLTRRGGATPAGLGGMLSSSRTEEKNWTYTIHNGRDQAVRVRVLDRIPVSEADEIKVEELQSPQVPVENDVDGKRGVRAWTFEVKPRSDLQASFGWRVSWPKDREATVE